MYLIINQNGSLRQSKYITKEIQSKLKSGQIFIVEFKKGKFYNIDGNLNRYEIIDY